MGVNVNDSSKEVVASGARWTGIALVSVTAINPTMEQMKAMKMNPQKEPVYLTKTADVKDKEGNIVEEGHDKFRLDIYLNNSEKKINAKLALWLENKIRRNKNGDKVQWVNKFGVFSWSPDEVQLPTYEYFKHDGARPAYIGEEKLVKFIIAWANCGPEDQSYLDNPGELAKGNMTELLSLYNAIPRNEFQVLLGVNNTADSNGKPASYQAVYDGHFDRKTGKRWDLWKKALENEYGEFKADYQNDYTLKEYIPRANQDAPTDMNKVSGGQTTNSGVPRF